jgi:MoaA/NifB/PqqE/SkfB family radical SAM enzyme
MEALDCSAKYAQHVFCHKSAPRVSLLRCSAVSSLWLKGWSVSKNMKSSDKRPSGYSYFKILKDHLGGDLTNIYNGKLIYPRQIEVHLPGNHNQACNFSCYYCQGGLLERPLDLNEKTVLTLMDEIGAGKCEYYIFGGAYTEPLINPYLMKCVKMAKKHNVNFGIHTNGSLFKTLEDEKGFLTELFGIMDEKDYISISLDAGLAESHMKTKGLKTNHFDKIIEGMKIMSQLQSRTKPEPVIRICYLLNEFNSSGEEIRRIVEIAKQLNVNSLRFSIPYDQYGKPFEKVREYKRNVEIRHNREYERALMPYVSENTNHRPHIFYFSPTNQDVDRMNYKQCIYSYYQITIASDGYVYKCSSIASPSFNYGRLGKLPCNRKEFEELIILNHNPQFNCDVCFKSGARCNRIALELNSEYNSKLRNA